MPTPNDETFALLLQWFAWMLLLFLSFFLVLGGR